MSESNNWQLEAVDQFMRSPEYKTPIMNYIDEKCIVFDDDEENKLEFTKIHEEFVELVFGLLEKFLVEIGLSTEEFAKTCSKELQRGENAFVYHSIMAADDFQSFKKMMAKRNYEFQLQAIEQLRNMQFTAGMCEALPEGDLADLPLPPGEGEDEEDEDFDEEMQLREAIRLSKMTFKEEDPELSEALRLSEMISEQQADTAKESEAKPSIQPSEEDIITPEELQSIKDLPVVTDEELKAVRTKHELAVIHHAIAMNEVSSKEEEEEEEEEEQASSAQQQLNEPAEESPAAVDASPKEQSEPEPPQVDADPSAGTELESSTSPVTDSKEPPSEPAQTTQRAGGSSLPAIVPRARPAMDMPGMQVDDLIQRESNEKKKERKALEKAALERKASELETLYKEPQLTPEEMEARKRYLEKQRSLILDRKKKEREEQLKVHNEQKQGQQPDSVKRNKSQYEKLASEVLAAVSETTKKEDETQQDEESKKLEMRRVLAKRILEEQHV
uniref:Cilia- and flagella-associated protein 36 n=1 Tax=Guillardia theta TaxID=55529 RepID=A0A7S4H8G5_GUITH|mmetsp:Transcript_10119/g.33732  ORF Transcript_10119/g.33732 Transcript_10119/m.33732 type:complete len:502 (+) Transcript_10119:14-1519(+)